MYIYHIMCKLMQYFLSFVMWTYYTYIKKEKRIFLLIFVRQDGLSFNANSLHVLFCRAGTTRTADFKCREVKTGFCRKSSMQTGSSGTLIGWKSGQTTYFPLWDRMEGSWLWTLMSIFFALEPVLQLGVLSDQWPTQKFFSQLLLVRIMEKTCLLNNKRWEDIERRGRRVTDAKEMRDRLAKADNEKRGVTDAK
jgi:hypothetical protein